MGSKQQHGFTVVEILVAMSVFSGLLLLTAYAWQPLAAITAKQSKILDTRYHQVMAQQQVFRSLEGGYPYFLPRGPTVGVYLFGGGQRLDYVTSAGVHSTQMVPVSLQVLNVNGQNQLLYQEYAAPPRVRYDVAGEALPLFENVQFSSHVALPSQARFRYFGYKNLEAKRNFEDEELGLSSTPPAYHSEYNGIHSLMLPQRIELELADGDSYQWLPKVDDPAITQNALQSYD